MSVRRLGTFGGRTEQRLPANGLPPVTISTAAPSDPLTGDLWDDNATIRTTAMWNGSAWQPVSLAAGRNLLDNASFLVKQRIPGTTNVSNTAGGIVLVDRWSVERSGNNVGNWSVTQVSGSSDQADPLLRNQVASLLMSCSASKEPGATDYLYLRQSFEGYNVQRFLWAGTATRGFTLSFWVKSSMTGTFIAQLTFSSGQNGQNVSAAYTVNAAHTWERKVITFPAGTNSATAVGADTGARMSLRFWLVAGSNFTTGSLQTTWANAADAGSATGQVNLAVNGTDTWAIAAPQLEAGSVATPFEFVPFDEELRRCQRYFWMPSTESQQSLIGMGFANTTTAAFIMVPFPTTMRAVPSTIYLTTTSASNYGVIIAGGTGSGTSCSVVPTIGDDCTANLGRAVFTVASGLTAGQGVRGRATKGHSIGWSADI